MNKSCGTCKWWDHAGKREYPNKKFASNCKYPLPILPDAILQMVDLESVWTMIEIEGVECQTYEAKK